METNLFWFGFVIELGIALVIIKLVNLGAQGTDKFDAERNRLRRDYQRLQQELKQKAELTQENLRLQQEVQQQKEQLTQEYLRLQQEVQQQEHQTQAHSHLQQLQQQKNQLAQDYLRLQQELQQQKDELAQQSLHLQQALQDQAAKLSGELRQSTFKQLQTLLTNYPSANKIAQLKPELPAKSLTAMLTPLDNLVQSWGYDVIGSVWEQVPYDPQLHQADANDLQPGDPVYVRYVGYRDGDRILCPAKVSRTLPGLTREPQPKASQSPVAE